MKLTLLDSQIDKIIAKTKIHATISDPLDKVKTGKRIDYRMENNQRYANPEIVSKQCIEIAVRKNSNNYELIYLQIDKKDCSAKLSEITMNEGFDTVPKYLEWIYSSAKEKPRVTLHILRGKIIHWTNLIY